jgi:hypothetical protein
MRRYVTLNSVISITSRSLALTHRERRVPSCRTYLRSGVSLSLCGFSRREVGCEVVGSLVGNVGGGGGGAGIGMMGAALGTDGRSLVTDTFSLDTNVAVGGSRRLIVVHHRSWQVRWEERRK